MLITRSGVLSFAWLKAKSAMVTLWWLVAASTCNAAGEDAKPPEPYNPYADVLKRHQVEPTLAGITTYLESLVPDEDALAERRQRYAALIAQLGDATYREREDAMLALMRHADVPVDLIRQAAEGDDPEVSWRAAKVLENLAKPNPLPEAVLRTICYLKIEGAAEPVLNVLPHLAQPHEQGAARDALALTATANDRPLLRELIEQERVELRLAAIKALGRVGGEKDLLVLEYVLSADGDEKLRLASAEALANQGRRVALSALVDLLESADVNTAVQAANLLRAFTGEQFGFIAYDEKLRSQSVDQWQTWLAEKGQDAELHHPLKLDNLAPLRGHTLVLLFQTHKLREYDASGKVIWELDGLQNPWAIERLPNGHTLLGSYRGKYVVEYDAEHREVWRADGLVGGVFGAQRLPNGNTVLACHDSNQVIEINRAGKTVWSHKFDQGQPLDAQRLPNGNTLVALYQENRVAEINRDGKVVWEITGLGVPRAVERLPNGNTLVVDDSKNRIEEYDPEGKSVWSYTDVQSPYDAQRLPNGDTLLTDAVGVRIIDQTGKTKWKLELTGTGRALRF